MNRIASLAVFAVLATTLAAQAHTGVGATHGFGAGFGHPFSGLDHIAAMLAVGLFAGRMGGKAIWLVPAAFVSMMAAGGALAMAQIGLPFVEAAIALSVVTLGLAVALEAKMTVWPAMILVGLFALFHGHAHGAEMPRSASGLFYGAGFVLATTILHALGVAIGVTFGGQPWARRALQAMGSAIAVTGIALLAGYA